MRSPLLSTALAALIALPAMGEAQARSTDRETVPVDMYPPAGKCRIWMFGVPPAQQPAPTDCATANRQRPANGIVLFGPSQRSSSERFDPKVGQEPRDTRTADERRDGSKAEQELEKRRGRAERARIEQEMRERDERARRDAATTSAVMRANEGRASRAAPSTPRGTTATPRSSTANSTAAGGGRPPSSSTASPPKSPPEGKKKPE